MTFVKNAFLKWICCICGNAIETGTHPQNPCSKCGAREWTPGS